MSETKKVKIVNDIPSYAGTQYELCKYNYTPFLVQAHGATVLDQNFDGTSQIINGTLGGNVVGCLITNTILENVYATNRLTWDSIPDPQEGDENLYQIITERSDGILIISSSADLDANPNIDLSIYDTIEFPSADERKPNTPATPGDMLWRDKQLHIFTYDGWVVLPLL